MAATPIICEIIKLAGRSLTSNVAFAHARKAAGNLGAKAQYYGEDMDDESLFWVLSE